MLSLQVKETLAPAPRATPGSRLDHARRMARILDLNPEWEAACDGTNACS
jgi:hypothetical protein